jgi:NIPSNAP
VKRLVEIRTYSLKPGALEEFHTAMVQHAAPLVRAAGMDIVAFGKSVHEQETYFLARAYADYEQLKAQQDAFYSSEAWKQGPRALLVSRIETYLNTLIWLSTESIEDMRRLNSANP